MAADGSVVIEIKGDADELLRAFRKVSKSADELERDIHGVANNFREAAAAANKMDGDGLEDASRAADRLDDNLDDAAQAANRLDNSMEQAGSGASKLSGGFTVLKGAVAGLVADIAMRAVDAFVDLGSEAINAADSLTKFESTMSFAGFSTAEIDAARDAVQNYASQTVYDLGEVANTTAQLAANGVQDYQKLTEAAGNLNAVAGGSADTFGSVAMVLTQTAGAGKLTTENWNQLADAIPGASGVIQNELKTMGAYTGEFRDAMAKGEISAEEFNQAIMNLGFSEAAIEASSSVSTIEGAVGNLRATIVDGFVAVLTDGGLMEGITGFINGIATILTNAGQYIGPAIDGIKTAISGIGDAFNKAFTSDQQAAILGFLKTLASALVGLPFQLVSAAVQAVSLAFQGLITIAGAVANFFSSTLPGALSSAASWFSNLPGIISGSLSSAFGAVNSWGSNVVSAISSAVSSAVNAVGSWFSQIPGRISGALSSALSALKSWGSQMASNAKSAMSKVVSNIASTLRTAISQVTNIGRQIVQGLANGIRSGVSAVVNAISDTVSSAISAAKSALGIASPSKVFFSFGRFVSIGFANGVESGVTFVRKSIKTVSDVTKKQIEKLNAEIEAIEAAAQKRQEEAASEQVAKSLYQSEVDAIEEEYAGKLPDALGKVADDAMSTFADRMATAGEASVNTAKSIADRVLAELERVNAAQRLTAAVGMSTSNFSASLGSKAQNDAEARTVARRASATETAMATAFMQTGKATRDVVLQVNGKEFARATLDDYRSVEDQSPRIVSD